MDKNNELFDLDTITSGIKPLSEKGVMDKDNDIGSGMFTFSSDNTLSYIESRIMPVKVESNLSDEDIDKVVDRLMKKVRVILDEINITANEGVLRGCANISLYLGRKHPAIGGRVANTARSMSSVGLKRWKTEKGFPLCHDPNGRYWACKSHIDRWIWERFIFERTAIKMGIKPIARKISIAVYPEVVSPEDKIRVYRQIAKDRAMRSVENE